LTLAVRGNIASIRCANMISVTRRAEAAMLPNVAHVGLIGLSAKLTTPILLWRPSSMRTKLPFAAQQKHGNTPMVSPWVFGSAKPLIWRRPGEIVTNDRFRRIGGFNRQFAIPARLVGKITHPTFPEQKKTPNLLGLIKYL